MSTVVQSINNPVVAKVVNMSNIKPLPPVAPPKSSLRPKTKVLPISQYNIRHSSQVLLESGSTKPSDHQPFRSSSSSPRSQNPQRQPSDDPSPSPSLPSLSFPPFPNKPSNSLDHQPNLQQQLIKEQHDPQQQQQELLKSKLEPDHSKIMQVSPRRNSFTTPVNPPSPFFDREEFLEPPSPTLQSPTAQISSQASSPPGTPSSPSPFQNRMSKAFTDPFSDSHRASVISNTSTSGPEEIPAVTAIRTPSISSIVSLSTKGGLPNFDVHVMYKIKTSNSSKKLSNFFGEQIPLDVCVKEIEREGLGALLHSKVPLCYFLRFLLDEYSSENLFFFIEVEQYESFEYHSRAQQFATAQHIYETYLTRNSQFEVNVEDRVRKMVVTALREQKDLLHCFDPAKRSVFALLEGAYTRHRFGSHWERMVREIGENTIHYDMNARNMAVNHLLEYIAQQHDALYTNPHTDALISNTSRRRHELLKSMIHEFCRSMVGVDFDYYRPEPEYNRPMTANPRSRSPVSDGENSSEGESSGVKIAGSTQGRQRSKSFVGKRNKEKLEGLFGKKGKPGNVNAI